MDSWIHLRLTASAVNYVSLPPLAFSTSLYSLVHTETLRHVLRYSPYTTSVPPTFCISVTITRLLVPWSFVLHSNCSSIFHLHMHRQLVL